jgi:hypothetical protein
MSITRKRRLSTAFLLPSLVFAATISSLFGGVATATPGDDPSSGDMSVQCVVPATRDLAVTRVVYQVGLNFGVSDRVMLAGFETGWVESHMNNLNCGDRDSLGVFQQRPSMGWGTPEQVLNVEYAATQFFTRAINSERGHPGFTAAMIAQDVQRSAFPDRYQAAEGMANQLIAEVAPSGVRADRVNQLNRDGYADLMAVADNGELFAYHNGSVVNANRQPFLGETWRVTGSDWRAARHLAAGDVTGDGYADLVAAMDDGRLAIYGNGIEQSASGVPYAGETWSYQGSWGSVRQLAVADVTGDGFADLVTVTSDGALSVYANGLRVNGTPFGGETWHINGNWSGVRHLALTDVNRDGYADIVAVLDNGQLVGYHNGSLVNAGRQPFLAETWRVNGNWSGVRQFTAGEFTGDGYGDILAVESDGTLSVYANGILGSPATPFSARSWSIAGNWSTVRTIA